ncbi:hypothetical protein J437_LFUL006122 [Ladona fulva]|uniref:Reverse transcriptase n=1 Tax=Ladona fulva TaxID=123851 RepID=A0A8K0KAI4_LADFU|nr:hypothetical protein J437_LFUL006122 [Ladona fulva]
MAFLVEILRETPVGGANPASYLSVAGAERTYERIASKGCPQVSVLGPFLWNVAINGLLVEPAETGVEKFAYADDLPSIPICNISTGGTPSPEGGTCAKFWYHRVRQAQGIIQVSNDSFPDSIAGAGMSLAQVRPRKQITPDGQLPFGSDDDDVPNYFGEGLNLNSWKKFIELESKKGPWSIPYKIALGKIKNKEIYHSIVENNSVVNNLEALPKFYLDNLFSNDDVNVDNNVHVVINNEVSSHYDNQCTLTLTDNEIEYAINDLGKRKAPGDDGINAEILQKGLKVFNKVITKMYRTCFEKEIFPNQWKIGLVKVLLKGADRDPTRIKSYRPICLLSVLGKAYEKMILKKLKNDT